MNCEKIKIFIEKLLRFFYPNTCPLCGRVIREEVCPDCARRVQPIREPLCKTCGKPIRSSQAEYCLDCSRTVHDFDCGRALYVHRGQAAWSIYQFKFHNRRIYGQVLCRAAGGPVRNPRSEVGRHPHPSHTTQQKEEAAARLQPGADPGPGAGREARHPRGHRKPCADPPHKTPADAGSRAAPAERAARL